MTINIINFAIYIPILFTHIFHHSFDVQYIYIKYPKCIQYSMYCTQCAPEENAQLSTETTTATTTSYRMYPSYILFLNSFIPKSSHIVDRISGKCSTFFFFLQPVSSSSSFASSSFTIYVCSTSYFFFYFFSSCSRIFCIISYTTRIHHTVSVFKNLYKIFFSVPIYIKRNH